MKPPDPPASESNGWTFWVGLLIGGVIMAFAVRGILADSRDTNPPELARWVVGAAILHDALLAPIATAAAVLLAWRAPAWWGRPVAFAAAMTAILVTFSIPLVRGFGRRAANPSTLPHDYGSNLALILAVLWATTLGVIGWRATARMRHGAPSTPPETAGPTAAEPGEQRRTDGGQVARRDPT